MEDGNDRDRRLAELADAAHKRYEAGQRYEEDGRPELAKLSYDRAAMDSRHEIAYRIKAFSTPEIELFELKKLCYRSNLNAARLYNASGDPEDKIQAGYACASAVRGALAIGDYVTAYDLSNIALEIFRDFDVYVPAKLWKSVTDAARMRPDEPNTGTPSQNKGIRKKSE